jgi:small multidrug resistance family-3 protein
MALRSILLFVLAAFAEIGGAWLVWQGVREHKIWIWIGAGVIALGLYGFVATLQPDAHFGGILTAYGGVSVAGSLAWGMVADGFRPDPLGHHRRAHLPGRRCRDHVRTPRRQLSPRLHSAVLAERSAIGELVPSWSERRANIRPEYSRLTAQRSWRSPYIAPSWKVPSSFQ